VGGETKLSASFLKRGINKLKGSHHWGKERGYAQVAARPCSAGYGRGAQSAQASQQPPCSRRLDNARSHDRLQLWDGLRTTQIAEELGCHPQTVRERFHRFNEEGLDGLGDRPGAGRKPRITEQELSKIIALVSKEPPGRLVTESDGLMRAEDETEAAYWTLDALVEAARQMGIRVGRSQVRRILLSEGVRWRNIRP
jgi:transposase